MSKKKILTVALCVALVAALVIGGSIAYFTDTKSAENVFTVGGVKIELIEQMRNEDRTALVDFEDGVLLPLVGSAQGAKDDFIMPVAKNYGDKIITVKNTGKSDAWVRVYFAIPSVLDDGYDTFNAGKNILHFNFGLKSADVSTDGVEWLWKHGSAWNYYETVIDGVNYNVYFADYYQPIAPNAITERYVQGVYLDNSFDVKTETVQPQEGSTAAPTTVDKYYAFGSEIQGIDRLLVDGELTIKCPVFAVAVQASGFDTAKDAVEAAFGAQYNPFGGTVSNWQ